MNDRARIRYFKTKKEGILKSNILISARTGANYQVVLNTNVPSFKIRNIKNGKILRSTEKEKSKAKNLAFIKTLIKTRLKELGVSFKLEVRRKLNEESNND